MERIIVLLIGYGFGLIQAGYLVGKFHKVDIRKEGSGNSGATNTARVLGLKAGLVTVFIDAAKCIVAIILVRSFFQDHESVQLLAMYTGLGVTVGHNFPFYMKFKGGKGIAAMGGLLITMGIFDNPWILLIPLAMLVLAVTFTRFVSVGSLMASFVFLLVVIALGEQGAFDLSRGNLLEMYGLVFALVGLAWCRHIDNIKRLIKGEENQFGSSK